MGPLTLAAQEGLLIRNFRPGDPAAVVFPKAQRVRNQAKGDVQDRHENPIDNRKDDRHLDGTEDVRELEPAVPEFSR